MKLFTTYLSLIILISFIHTSYGEEKTEKLKLNGFVVDSFEKASNMILKKFEKSLLINAEFNIKSLNDSKDILEKMNKDADFIVIDFPLSSEEQEKLGGDRIYQSPIATGAVALILNKKNKAKSHTEMKSSDLCKLITRADSSLEIYAPKYESGLIWDLTTYLSITGCNITKSRVLEQKSGIHLKDSMDDIISEVEENENALGIVWYGYKKNLNTVKLWVDKAEGFIDVTESGIKNNLMQLHSFTISPSGWNDFTLTDMSKMPNDNSCSRKPPYPLSRYYFIVFKKDFDKMNNKVVASLVRFINDEVIGNLQLPIYLTDISDHIADLNIRDLEKIVDFSELNKIAKLFSEYTPVKKINDHEVAHNQTSSGAIFITSFLTLFSGIIVVGIYSLLKRRNRNISVFKNII